MDEDSVEYVLSRTAFFELPGGEALLRKHRRLEQRLSLSLVTSPSKSLAISEMESGLEAFPYSEDFGEGGSFLDWPPPLGSENGHCILEKVEKEGLLVVSRRSAVRLISKWLNKYAFLIYFV